MSANLVSKRQSMFFLIEDMAFFIALLLLMGPWFYMYGSETYQRLLDSYGEHVMLTWGPLSLLLIVYWVPSLLYMYADLTRSPFLAKYKIQKEKHATVGDYVKCGSLVLLNMLLVNLPMQLLFAKLFVLRGGRVALPLPSVFELVRDLAGYLIVEELGFYYSHRMFHHPKLYPHIHKLHHSFTAPVAMAAIYAHPLEHLVANTIPLLLGPLAMGSHLLTATLWWMFAIVNTLNSHSGYCLPGLPASTVHDFHHSHFNFNFGMLGVLDRLHGTNSGYIKWLEKKQQEANGSTGSDANAKTSKLQESKAN